MSESSFTYLRKVIKVGDSAAVTIPSRIVKMYGIKVGDYVGVTISESKNPRAKATITIEQLSPAEQARLKESE